MSPASGDKCTLIWGSNERTVSIQLMSPASGDLTEEDRKWRESPLVSIQLMSPASGDVLNVEGTWSGKQMFPFN